MTTGKELMYEETYYEEYVEMIAEMICSECLKYFRTDVTFAGDDIDYNDTVFCQCEECGCYTEHTISRVFEYK